MDYSLRCTVFPGQFAGELAVAGRQFDGSSFSLFVPDELVESEEAPTRDRQVNGWLRVEVWTHKADMVLVKLPRQSFESGQYVTVKPDQIQPRRQGVGSPS